jgi:hypothetical protein
MEPDFDAPSRSLCAGECHDDRTPLSWNASETNWLKNRLDNHTPGTWAITARSSRGTG